MKSQIRITDSTGNVFHFDAIGLRAIEVDGQEWEPKTLRSAVEIKLEQDNWDIESRLDALETLTGRLDIIHGPCVPHGRNHGETSLEDLERIEKRLDAIEKQQKDIGDLVLIHEKRINALNYICLTNEERLILHIRAAPPKRRQKPPAAPPRHETGKKGSR